MSGRKKAKPPLVREPSDAANAEAKTVGTKTLEPKNLESKTLESRTLESRTLESKAHDSKGEGGATQEGKPQKQPRRRKRGATALEGRIGYRFTDVEILESALTHISALKGARNRANSYQRLEFLGDHVLGLVISDMLYRTYPKADEGELSRRLADLVRKETCAEIARAIDLGAAIRVGASEANAGARSRPAILADVCEAVIGAVYLDGGYKAAEGLVERLWEVRLRATAQPLRDPKTVLQEWAQARGLPTPVYREVARSGPDHNPEFRVAVQLPTFGSTEGVARSKRAAEQAAAAAMLARAGVKIAKRDG